MTPLPLSLSLSLSLSIYIYIYISLIDSYYFMQSCLLLTWRFHVLFWNPCNRKWYGLHLRGSTEQFGEQQRRTPVTGSVLTFYSQCVDGLSAVLFGVVCCLFATSMFIHSFFSSTVRHSNMSDITIKYLIKYLGLFILSVILTLTVVGSTFGLCFERCVMNRILYFYYNYPKIVQQRNCI